MSRLLLGLPSKGRLQAEAVAWFARRGIEIAREGDAREYAASARGLEGLDVVMLAAAEIPRELAAGRLHLGVTGEDLIREELPGHEAQVRMAASMGFGHADLVVAVPAAWVDVETMHDLDEAAHEFRRRHGRRLRIATKYHNLARAFLRGAGVADYRLVDSQGATEAGPKNLTAEAIIDITTSGATMRANHLRALEDGLILRSQAMLCVSRTALWEGEAEAVLAALEARLDQPAA
ncbi:MAG TPA: ATP phosphoribosyltransferase [Paracoccaceae bacterium]|nr:ATP phosphoribosyltransferase [Paracoccaceae bacterium]